MYVCIRIHVDRALVRSPFSFVEGALGTRLGTLTILTAYIISPFTREIRKSFKL